MFSPRGWLAAVTACVATAALAAAPPARPPQPFHPMAQSKPSPVAKGAAPDPHEWRSYANDPGNMRFSAADQITPANVAQLKPIWVYTPAAEAAAGAFKSTPLVVDGVMYVSDPVDGAAALDPETGRVLWTFRAPVRGATRALSWWPGDAKHPPRLFYGLRDRVYALDPKTGSPIRDFGAGGAGFIDLRIGITEQWPDNNWGISSQPAIAGNVLIVGGVTQYWAFGTRGAPADPRAYDVVTGRPLWRFNLVPRPGQPNAGSWGPDWRDITGPSAWGAMAVDETLGLVYIPIGNAASLFLGLERPGDNLYSASVVALDYRTGKYRWHFQMTHHEVWDYDVGAPPALVDITVRGRKIPALVQANKIGLLFILDRRTGKPVFGVEERPVPASMIPGEQTSPTQPFPLKPAPLTPLGVRRNDLNSVVPEAFWGCRDLWDREGMTDSEFYTPTKLVGATVFRPGHMAALAGGGGGVSYSPQLGYIFVNTRNAISWHKVETDGKSGVRMVGPYGVMRDPTTGLSCANPPWSELIAIKAATGDIAWRRPLGIEERLGEKGLLLGNPGDSPASGGTLATAGGLVFTASTGDARIRAFDGFNGLELWVQRLPANAQGTPMTFVGQSGRQYVLIAAGQSAEARALIAFAVPRPGEAAAPLTYAAPPPLVATSNMTSAGTTPRAPSVPRGPQDLADGPGRDAFLAMCAGCHDVQTSVGLRRTPTEWQAVVTQMRLFGAPGDDAAAAAVRAYLSAHYGRPG